MSQVIRLNPSASVSVNARRTPAVIKHEACPRIVKQDFDWACAAWLLLIAIVGDFWWGWVFYELGHAVRVALQ